MIGGSGRIGRSVAKRLAGAEIVSKISIGARDLEIAERVAVEIGTKASAIRADAADEARLVSLARGHDLLVNTAGPDFVTALPVARAAIAAGIPCVDICADGPTVEELLALDGKAMDSDVAIVTGIGHVPGTSNLLLQHAADQLDVVADLRLCFWWDLSRERALFGDPRETRKTGRSNASWQQVLRWVAHPVRTHRDGHEVDVEPFDEMTKVALPNGQSVMAIPVGSTEPITLPRRNPALLSVSVLMGLHPPQLNELLRDHASRIATGESDAATATIAFLEELMANPMRWLTSQMHVPSEFGMFASATGRLRRQTARFSCWPAGPWESTVGPLTVAALRILRGDVRARGVLSPESAFDPMDFLREAAAYGPNPPTGVPLLNESKEVLGS